jgi:hypothetical protein
MIVVLVVVIITIALLAPLVIEEARSNSITTQIEQAGGFIGSSQPPEWMDPVYDLVCRSEFFCKPYQLILDGSEMTPEMLSSAAELKHLRCLDLYEAIITKADLKHLKGMKQIDTLSLWRCTLSEITVEELQRALPSVRIVDETKTGQPEEGEVSTESALSVELSS